MSAAAVWSFTHKATWWPLLSRADWSGGLTFGAPASFNCDYSAESVRMTDDRGVEFTTRQLLYTEFERARQGDYVLIGESVEVDPIAAGAFEVRAITRYADTFDSAADDYRIAT